MWSDFDIYFQNLEEDQACAQALDCVEVFGTDGVDPLMDVLYGMDQEFGLPVEDQGFGLPVEDEDDDEACHRTMDQFDYQQRLLSQSGGALDQPGRLEFDLQPYVDRQSTKMGVRERHFSTRHFSKPVILFADTKYHRGTGTGFTSSHA